MCVCVCVCVLFTFHEIGVNFAYIETNYIYVFTSFRLNTTLNSPHGNEDFFWYYCLETLCL